MKTIFVAIVTLLLMATAVSVPQAGQAGGGHKKNRFVDNGDGTITDRSTGLMWEQKTGTPGAAVFCTALSDCPIPHDVNNVYAWSSTGDAPDGLLFTNFLERVNGKLCETSDCGGLAGHSDWRIPTIAELRTILQPPCSGLAACIAANFGPTQADLYWSSTTYPLLPYNAWAVNFEVGSVVVDQKIYNQGTYTFFLNSFARAVRGGQ